MADQLDRLKAALADRYRIEREIGAGGMATVYLAEDLKHHREVAVKVLRPELTATVGADRFLREIEIAAQIHHPHILQLHDSGLTDGFLYYVMPYVEDGSLRARLSRGPSIPVSDAVRILRDVVDGLAHAHQRGVVHRDVKPDNVMLSGRHALVTDFGIAKAVSEAAHGTQLTLGGVSLGTPGYMAPEQAAGDPSVDHRADIYAVGIVGYELLTGRLPFPHAAPQAMLAAHVTKTPDPVAKHRPGLPPDLTQLIMRCLEKKPSDRWQSADEVLARLEALTTPSGGTAPFVRAARSLAVARWPKRVLIGTVVAVMAGVAAWLTLIDRGPVLDDDKVLVAGMENRTGDSSLAHLGSIAVDWLTRGLQETGVIRVIDGRLLAAHPLGFGSAGPSGVATALTVARNARAATVLSGAFYRQRDSVQFQVQITEAATGELRHSLEPIAAPLDDPLEAVEELRQRVMSTLAALVRFDVRTIPIKPPTYEAYRELITGLTLMAQRDLEGATRSALRAASMDTTFNAALLLASGTMIGRGRFAEADSVLEVLNRKRGSLNEMERNAVDGQIARLRGNLVEWLARTYRAAEFLGPSFDQVEGALWLNRPREAIEVLEQLDPTDPLSGGRVDYWDHLHDAYHMLGDYDRALDAGRRARDQYPDARRAVLTDVETLAALGRLEELERRLDDAAALPLQGDNIGDVMLGAYEELRAHGHPEQARSILETFLDWAADRPVDESQWPEQRLRVAVGLAYDERLVEASEMIESLTTDNMERLVEGGIQGVFAAFQGDRETAMEISNALRDLDNPYLFGYNTVFRARIAAALGDRDQAVALLRQAFSEGLTYGMWLHRDVVFESMRQYPPFQELLRPKG